MGMRLLLSFVLVFLFHSLQLCFAQNVSHYPVQCPTIGGSCEAGRSDTAEYTSPTTLTISGYVEVILPTTDGLGSTIDVTGIVTTNSLAQPSTSYLPIVNVVTESAGGQTIIQLPLTDGQGSLVIVPGVISTNGAGQRTTAFQSITVTNSGSTGLVTEIVVPTAQSGGSVGYGLGTISSASGRVETVIGGIPYRPPVPQATATGSPVAATTSATRSQATVPSSGSTDGTANGPIKTGTTASGSWIFSRSTRSVQSPSVGPKSNSPSISSSQQTNSSTHANIPANDQSSGSGQRSTSQPVTTSAPQDPGNPSATLAASTESSSTGNGGPAQLIMSSATGPITPAASLVSRTSATGLGYYPSTVTFVTTHDGASEVGIAFLTTTSGGRSIITNSVPQQSVVGTGIVVVTLDGTTTTVTLSSLPTPEPLPRENGVQIVTESGVAVTYSPRTLSGFASLTAPFEISTAFVETINGHVTTQAGWWLIGSGGVINPPDDQPWERPGPGGIGCLGGPLFCDPSIMIIGGGVGIRLPGLNLPKGTIGPPGYPGGKIGGGGSDPDPDDNPPPPYEEPGDEESEDETDANKTTDQQKKTTDEMKTTNQQTSDERTSRLPSQSTPVSSSISNTATRSSQSTTLSRISSLSFSTSGSSTQSTTASGVAEYFIIAASGAAQADINALLEQWDPSKGTVQPDVGSTDASGGTWIDYELDPQEAQSLLSRNDIILIETCASVSQYPPDSLFTSMSTMKTWNATLVTLESATGQVTPAPQAKERRGGAEPVWREAVSTQPPSSARTVTGTEYVKRPRDFRFSRPSPNEERKDHGAEHNSAILEKRDPGTRLVRQIKSNKDLSVLAQPPGVPSVDDVDYIFEETKGENTWVYLVDVGVEDNYVSHYI